MNWLKNLAFKWAMSNRADEAKISSSGLMVKEDNSEDTITFHLTPAIGGRILRVTRDTNRGNTFSRESQTYVIPSGEDVGARVTKIINMEALK